MRGLTRKDWLGIGLILVVIFGSIALVIDQRNARRSANVRSILNNCQQIEVIKTELRGTIRDGLRNLDRVAYYRDRPEEKARAVRNGQRTLERFRASDCYALPVIRAAGVKR